MSEDCTHECSTCSSDCGSSTQNNSVPLHEDATVRHVYAVCGGKGGVGRTTIACLLASAIQEKHLQAAVLDADVTGPCVPSAFGVSGRLVPDDRGMFPIETQSGIQTVSVNLIIPNPTDPVLARGTLIDNTLKKFWGQTIWEEVDLMLVDMPAGTGEVPLSVMRTVPLEGMIVVTEPGKTAAVITEKTLKMAKALQLPVIGMIINRASGMGGSSEPDPGCEYAEKLAETYGVTLTMHVPYDQQLAGFMDDGEIEMYHSLDFTQLIDRMF